MLFDVCRGLPWIPLEQERHRVSNSFFLRCRNRLCRRRSGGIPPGNITVSRRRRVVILHGLDCCIPAKTPVQRNRSAIDCTRIAPTGKPMTTREVARYRRNTQTRLCEGILTSRREKMPCEAMTSEHKLITTVSFCEQRGNRGRRKLGVAQKRRILLEYASMT